MTARAITYRLANFEALGFYVPPMTDEQRKARVWQWFRSLEPIPCPFAAGAFDEWFSRMSRTPTPGDIANGARTIIANAVRRLDLMRRDDQPPERFELTEEEIARRREFAARMAEEFPGLLKGGA